MLPFRQARTGAEMLALLAALAQSMSVFNAGAQDSSGASTVGTPWAGWVGIREAMSEMAAHDRAQVSKPSRLHAKPRLLLPGAAVAANGGAIKSASAEVGTLAAQTVNSNLNFTAATFSDGSGWPPDTMGAAGPAQFIIALNGRVRSFNKTSGLADSGIDTGTDSFFSSVLTPGANFTTDPRIRYDRISGRWFITMIDVPGQQGKLPNRVMIAMSDSGIITPGTVLTFFH